MRSLLLFPSSFSFSFIFSCNPLAASRGIVHINTRKMKGNTIQRQAGNKTCQAGKKAKGKENLQELEETNVRSFLFFSLLFFPSFSSSFPASLTHLLSAYFLFSLILVFFPSYLLILSSLRLFSFPLPFSSFSFFSCSFSFSLISLPGHLSLCISSLLLFSLPSPLPLPSSSFSS